MGSYQKEVSDYFVHSGMFYIVGLAHIFNSIQAGILLSQLLYWHDRTDDPYGWVYKSVSDFYKETGLNRSGQETAIKKLKSLNIIEVRLFGIPATRHFRINTEQLDTLLSTLYEPNVQEIQESTNKFAENRQTNTYSTQDTKTNINSLNSFIEFAHSQEFPP